MHHPAHVAGRPVILLTVRDRIVEGCDLYEPGLPVVSVILTVDRRGDADRLRGALASLPHVPALRA